MAVFGYCKHIFSVQMNSEKLSICILWMECVALIAPSNSGRHFLVEMLDYLIWLGRASQHVQYQLSINPGAQYDEARKFSIEPEVLGYPRHDFVVQHYLRTPTHNLDGVQHVINASELSRYSTQFSDLRYLS